MFRETLLTGCMLFALGAAGLVARRGSIHLILSSGMMIAGVIATAAGGGAFHGHAQGEVFGVIGVIWFATFALLLVALILRVGHRDRAGQRDEPFPDAAASADHADAGEIS